MVYKMEVNSLNGWPPLSTKPAFHVSFRCAARFGLPPHAQSTASFKLFFAQSPQHLLRSHAPSLLPNVSHTAPTNRHTKMLTAAHLPIKQALPMSRPMAVLILSFAVLLGLAAAGPAVSFSGDFRVLLVCP